MATGAEIQSALADAYENDISFQDMAVLVRRAINSALVTGATTVEIPWTSAASRGTQITRSIDDALNLHTRLLSLANGGIVSQNAEFTDQ